ncbi:MAG: hypothetical protein AABZ34_14855, partial [Nitrospirota bacterium]
MTWSIRFWLLTLAIMSLVFWTDERRIAHAADLTPQPSLVLPDLIQEALARNPEIVAVRKQWEAASQRIAQARTLDDP